MPLLSFQTTVDPEKTASEVMDRLRKAKALEISMTYDDDQHVDGLKFRIKTPHGEQPFELPVNASAVLEVLSRQNVPMRYCNLAQARRVAWRHILTWVKGQLALIETGQASFDQVFLPYLIWNGQTLYEQLAAGDFRLALPAPEARAIALQEAAP